jgi:hypothetical protein
MGNVSLSFQGSELYGQIKHSLKNVTDSEIESRFQEQDVKDFLSANGLGSATVPTKMRALFLLDELEDDEEFGKMASLANIAFKTDVFKSP